MPVADQRFVGYSTKVPIAAMTERHGNQDARRRAPGQEVGERRKFLLEELFSTHASDESSRDTAHLSGKMTENVSRGFRLEGRGLQVTGLYIISVAARLAEMHPQTLRKYERVGLLSPSRTSGSLRLYSEEDLARLRMIRTLIDRFGLTLAGVRLVMGIAERVAETLDALESDEQILRNRQGMAAAAELRALLRSVGAE